jgi:hypothetical protein
MLRPMRRETAPRRWAAGLVVLVALAGAWMGHTAEYLRVGGGARLPRALLGGVHVYMLPLGAVLGLACAIAGVGCWRLWLGLGRRLDGARDALRRAWRGEPGRAELRPSASPVSGPSRWAALWLLLGSLQISFYLVQENVESVLARGAPAGLGPLLGVHAAAALVHAAVALVLATALVPLGRGLGRREEAVVRCERLLRTLWQRLAVRPPAVRRRARPWTPSLAERLGVHLWRRPPPTTL